MGEMASSLRVAVILSGRKQKPSATAGRAGLESREMAVTSIARCAARVTLAATFVAAGSYLARQAAGKQQAE